MSKRQANPVFLSYASADRQRALAVADALEAAGVRVWIDRRGIAGGTLWIEEIARAVREAPALLVLCSAASVNSRNVRQELQLAWDQEKPILPLLLEPVEFPDGVAYVLHGRQWIDLGERSAAEWVAEVRQALARLDSVPNLTRVPPSSPSVTATGPDPRRAHLPAPPNPLLGRQAEVAAVARAIDEEGARLVTLTGPGGTGKTRLALAVAAHLAPAFAQNVFFVDLAPVRSGDLLLATIAQAVGVQDLGGQPLRESLQLRFAGERHLLVLDNFEQLVEEASLLAELLADSPDLHLLVTSRALLHLRAEREIPVAPLPQTDAIALFAERARIAKPGFAVTSENAEAIAEICRRLDGLPLAIELAAARTKVLSPQALLARLERRLPLLGGGARDLPARQQTLRDAIAWSYDLLSIEEQLLFRQFAVFVGGWTLEAAEAVCATNDDLLDLLALLVDKSLVTQSEDADGEPRFGMLETIREFAAERLAASGDESAVRNRHAAWCLALAEHVETGPTFPNLKPWLNKIDLEISNLRAALAWLDQSNQPVMSLRLMAGMFTYWWLIGPIREGRAWLEDLIPRTDDAPPASRVQALVNGGYLVFQQGDIRRYHDLATEGLMLARQIADQPNEIYCLLQLGKIAEVNAEFDFAELRYGEALELARALDRNDLIGFALQQCGYLAWERGDLDRSISVLSEALVRCQEAGDHFFVALVHWRLGRAIRDQGYVARAESLIRKSIAIWSEIGRVSFIGFALVDLAGIIAGQGQPERAAKLLGAAERIRESVGVPVWSSDQARYAKSDAAVRAALGEHAFGDAHRRGREMPWEQVIAVALPESDPPVAGCER